MGCQQDCTVGDCSVVALLCPIVDTDAVLSYTSASAFFANSNPTQPSFACVTFAFQQGGTCSGTPTNNCPNLGVCAFNLNISAWQNNMGQFKYVKFTNLTSGALLGGYQVNYDSSI